MFSYIWNTTGENVQRVSNTPQISRKVLGITPILWREHCMECSMPLCYKTCPLYEKRMDGRCARFAKGINRVLFDDIPIKGARIEFRRWAKLQAFVPFQPKIIPLSEYESLANKHSACERLFRRLCDMIGRYRVAQIVASLLERCLKNRKIKGACLPDGFLAIIKNEEQKKRELMLEILQDDVSIYKTKFVLMPGWNESFIPIFNINLPNKESKKRQIRAYLNSDETGTFTFAYFDFVKREVEKNAKPASKVKCVAWDLDNTLWEGVIGDDGADNVRINKDALKLIKELDERGIIQTIASKNNYDIAWNKIIELGLEKMFLYPAINWEQKSRNLQKVADLLNIGVDTFVLIDDSAFERAEVASSLPQVRVYDVTEIDTLLAKDEFDVPISEESKNRRQSYLNEVERKNFSTSWEGTDGDYVGFLRACNLKMHIFTPLSESERTRCLELILRSNQYNVSGNRYTKEDFTQLLLSDDYKCLAFRIEDRFGDYGIVGFASFEHNQKELILKDFVMSCRVAMKHAERAFFCAVMSSSMFLDCSTLIINAVKTKRNNPLREQLLKMPVILDEEDETRLKVSLSKSISFEDENIFTIRFDEK